MSRYSNWKTKLGLLAVLSAILVPVGIYTFGEAMPYLNLLSVTEDPSNMVLTAMEVVEKEYDESGENWVSCIWRLDLNFTNSLSSPVIVPRASLSINYMDGKLGNGWISEPVRIEGGETKKVKAYLKTTPGRPFDAMMLAILMGQPLNLLADFEAYILIDGMLGEPYIGVKFPTVLRFPIPTEVSPVPPAIEGITQGQVKNAQSVEINVSAFDVGTGIAESKLLYSINGNEWNELSMTGPDWDWSYKGTSTKRPFPIASSNPDTPQYYNASIPAQPAGTNVSYKIYLEDYTGNTLHLEEGNSMESDVYNYTVPSDPDIVDSSTILIDNEITQSFFMDFIHYVESRGINVLYWLKTQGKHLLAQLPYMDELGQFFFENNVDFDYWMQVFIHDFKHSVEIMEDSGVSGGKLMEVLEVNFTLMWEHILEYIFLEPAEDIIELAQNLWENGVEDGDYTNSWDLKALFDDLSIDQPDMYYFIDTTFRDLYATEIGNLPLDPGHVIPPDSMDTFLGIYSFGYWDFIPRSTSGQHPYLRDDAYQCYIDLLRSANESNYHFAAANYIMAEYGNIEEHSEGLAAIVGTEIVPPGNPFPLDDLYPYTHQLTTIGIFFPLAIVSYLVIKRELISHRYIKKDLAIKRTFKKKGSTSYK